MSEDQTPSTNAVFNATLCRWEPLVLTARQVEAKRVHDLFLLMVRRSMEA